MRKRSYILPVIIFTTCFAFACRKATTFSSTGIIVPHDTLKVNTPAANDSTTKTFLALGDSYTIGQSVNIEDRFPAQTAVLLRGSGFNLSEPEYIATSGWTTLNLQNAINLQNPAGPYDIVTLLIGVNDQYQTGGDTIGYRERFTWLLQKSIQLAGGKASNVFVLSIPDYSVTPFANGSDIAAISKQIDAFNAINNEVTVNLHASYTDITPSTREAAHDPELIAVDNLHPSGKEYAIWAKLLLPKIASALK